MASRAATPVLAKRADAIATRRGRHPPSSISGDRGAYNNERPVVVSQDQMTIQRERRVECLTRQADGSWNLRDYRDDGQVPLLSLTSPLLLQQIYDGVAFES